MNRLHWLLLAAIAAAAGAVALWLAAWWVGLVDAALVLAFGVALSRRPRRSPAPVPDPPIKPRPYHPLSAREYEVAKLACSGLRNREIAERLFVVEDTVENHLQHAYGKLGLGGGNPRMQLCSWLHERGLA